MRTKLISLLRFLVVLIVIFGLKWYYNVPFNASLINTAFSNTFSGKSNSYLDETISFKQDDIEGFTHNFFEQVKKINANEMKELQVAIDFIAFGVVRYQIENEGLDGSNMSEKDMIVKALDTIYRFMKGVDRPCLRNVLFFAAKLKIELPQYWKEFKSLDANK